ncbi:hypothetical protein K450DRAFT_240784 [Umbelopsis ramanniana AG]|uniref:F-box domain-containing protein n=1 Tax=Umbelopsis ramanniana AG TaxID=1314678 RepID=A0AAD5E908_UMBRA|nr:uncharacterized protein K450DRAFT_240784 [Umbelopsis ramanniana AG]KAI8579643.1 hypothetical protein K450DRAFT_240784 [Umbelopsis ramanniana AG]
MGTGLVPGKELIATNNFCDSHLNHITRLHPNMLYHGNSFLNYDLWMNITSYLEVQDVLNASMSCRAWYRQLAHQSLWEKVYTSILPGYPTDHFRINHDILNCARPEFVSMDGNGPAMLSKWYKTSWKQRAVYLAHILRVQSAVISTMRQKTKAFLDIPAQPLHDVERINRFERTYGATFPIDFVIFAIYFAHHLRVDQSNRHEPSMGLVSGECFENPHLWKYWADKFNFQALNLGNSQQPIIMEGYGPLQDQTFRNMMIFPFSQLTKCDELNKAQFLGMALSRDNSFPPMRPKNGRLPHVPDDSNLEDASGFVYRASFTALQEKTYGLEALCESFTDYLVQYTGVVLEYGDVPQYGRIGFVDLMIGLPRDHSPKISILLPHALDWDIGSYLPTEFTLMDSSIPVFTSLEHQIDCSYSKAVDNLGYATESSVAVPPRQLFMAAQDQHRHNQLHSRHDVKAPKPNTIKLADFGTGQYPPVMTIRLPLDVYQRLMEQAEEWISTSGSTLGTITRQVDGTQLQVIRHITSDMMGLYHLHHRCMPVSLFYDTAERTAYDFILTSKEFYDHVKALETEIIKYSAFELGVIAKRFKHQLNHLGYLIGRFENPKTDWMVRVKADLGEIPSLTWNEFNSKC